MEVSLDVIVSEVSAWRHKQRILEKPPRLFCHVTHLITELSAPKMIMIANTSSSPNLL